MDMTWERLRLLSLCKKRPKQIIFRVENRNSLAANRRYAYAKTAKTGAHAFGMYW